MPISSEATWVSLPNSLAAIWSTEIPARRSAPEVIFAWVPVSQAVQARG
jgi:hypothetical protein